MSSFSKKFISVALSLSTVVWMSGAMLLVPAAAQAQSTSDLAAQVMALMAQIKTLQDELAAAKGGTMTSVTAQFTRDLTVGSKGEEVTNLQQVLIDKGYLKISAPTGYFGPLTKKALAAWQKDQGVTPSVGYFGPKTRAALNAILSAAAAASTGTGTTTTPPPSTGTTTGTGTTVPATGLAVSLASDSPTSGSLVSTSGGNAAARVPVLKVNLTAGNASGVTVSQLMFHKQGLISDSGISSAYLVEGGKVLTQFTSISNGVITFSGLNLSVAAGQTRALTLAIDPAASSLNSGNTVSFSLNAASDVTAVDATNASVTAAGTFPINGGVFTVTTVSNPGVAALTINSSTAQGSVYAGSQAVLVSQWTVTANTNPVKLQSINFRVVGSANKADIKNVVLKINGTQVGQTLSSVSPDGTAYFDLSSGSSSPATITTGNNLMQVYADIMGSPSFSFQFELLNSYDVYGVDSTYNVPVQTTINGGAGTLVSITQGQLTVSLASDSPTGNVSAGSSNVALEKFTIYAAGEPVKVKFLTFKITFNTSTATLANWLKNVNLTDDAGNQIGTTINTPPSATTNSCDVSAGGSSSNTSWQTSGAYNGTYTDCFGTSASNINYIVPANTTRVLTLRADVPSGASFSTLTAAMTGNTSNLQGQVSSQLNSSGGVTGNTLNLVSTLLTAGQNNIGTPLVAAPSSNVKIGSYTLTASTAEGVNVSSISITPGSFAPTSLQNLKLMVGNTQFGTTQPTVSATAYAFSGTLSVAAGQTQVVDVYADILSGATSSSAATSLSGCTGVGATSLSSVSCSAVTGQGVTVGGGLTVAVSKDNNSPAAGQITMGSTGNQLAIYSFQENSSVDDVRVTDVYLTDAVTSTSTVNSSFSNLTLTIGNTAATSYSPVGTTNANGSPAYYYHFTFPSPGFIIPKGGSVSAVLKGDVIAYSPSGGATDNQAHAFQIATTTTSGLTTNGTVIVAYGRTASGATVTISGTPVAGNAQTVLQGRLILSTTPVSGSLNKSAHQALGSITLAADASGRQIMLNSIKVTVNGTAVTSTLPVGSSLTLEDNNGDITTLSGITATSTGTCTATGTNCAKTWTFATSSYKITPGSPVTFTVYANTSANTNVASGNSSVGLNVQIAANTDVAYTDATDGTGVAVTLPSKLPAPLNTFPVTIASVQYQNQ